MAGKNKVCLVCGAKMITAGISNQISGRRYRGLKELIDEEWIVCPDCYYQDGLGDWDRVYE